jgi:hypothetical protein
MEASLVCRPVKKGRPGRISWAQGFAFGTYLLAFAFTSRANAQARDTRAPDTPSHEQSARRARSIHANRTALVREPKRDYAADLADDPFAEGHGDIGVLEKRIADLSTKVRELTDLLQRHKDVGRPVHAEARPLRFTLLERHRAPIVPQTYGDALSALVRERARAIRATLGDPEQQKNLAIDPEPAEADRLIEPAYQWLDQAGTRTQKASAHLRAFIYVTLLTARAGIACAEPLPAQHKLLRDLRLDRDALAEHLRRSFLLDRAGPQRDLAAALAATAANYSEPASVREFLMWIAEGVGSDLETEFLRSSAYPYRIDPGGQFAAASENATYDNGAVLKLQIELQRMLVEAKALRATKRVDEDTAGTWQHRLLSAERELDLLLRAADSEREAVMTLARRVPIEREPISVTEQLSEPVPVEARERLASDDLTTQH